jgi:hypothetical protein
MKHMIAATFTLIGLALTTGAFAAEPGRDGDGVSDDHGADATTAPDAHETKGRVIQVPNCPPGTHLEVTELGDGSLSIDCVANEWAEV